MYIYSQERLNDTEIIGSKMLLMYLKDDEEAVKGLKEALDERGIYYRAVGKGVEECRKNDYVSDIEREMAACKIAVVVLSKAFFNERNLTLQNVTWYEIGNMLGMGKKIVLYFSDIERSEVNDLLHRTPVRQIQGCHTFEDLLAFISKCNIMENVFYSSAEINKYAAKLIFYVKLTTVFNVFRSNIATMREHVNRFESEEKSEKEVLDAFLSELVCGCTVSRFNRRDELGKPFAPFLDETEIIPKDFPVNFKYSKPQLLEYSSASDIYATVKSDFILPVHALLGVDFKPFIAVKKRSKFKIDHLLDLLKKNFGNDDLSARDVFVKQDDKLQRAYFLLELRAVDGTGLNVGEKVNYLFPQ